MKIRTILPIVLLLCVTIICLIGTATHADRPNDSTTTPDNVSTRPSVTSSTNNIGSPIANDWTYGDATVLSSAAYRAANSVTPTNLSKGEYDLEIWDGSIADSFAAGNGSETEPYLIENASQLALMAYWVNDVGYDLSDTSFALGCDIALNSYTDMTSADTAVPANIWTPIGGVGETAFSGRFDGNGFIIYGIYTENAESGGLFGFCAGNAKVYQESETPTCVIANLKISHSYINASRFVAAVCGRAQDGVLFENIEASSTVTIHTTAGYDDSSSGTIVGSGSGISLLRCTSSATVDGFAVSGFYSYVGGIVGSFYGVIEESGFFGTVYSDGVGGLIAGRAGSPTKGSGIIRSSVSKGTLHCGPDNMYAGALCGISSAASGDIYNSIENCIISARLFRSSTDSCIGIISGIHMSSGTIKNVAYNAEKMVNDSTDGICGYGFSLNQRYFEDVIPLPDSAFSEN